MKKNIFLAGLLLVVGLTSCSDFLDVESDSKYEDDYVFGHKEEISRALTGVYNYLLSSNTYGGAFYTTFCLNSDVEFTTNDKEMQSTKGDGYKTFDCTPYGSALEKTWLAAYTNIEYANNFIKAASDSQFAIEGDSVVLSQIAEAKCIRAMNYHDLVVLFGDVPLKLERSWDNPHDLVPPIVSRDSTLKTLIADLREAAPVLKFAQENGTVRRVSKEFCWALIARMSLTYAGYSLRPSTTQPEGTMERPENYREYYKIAMEYADSVIKSNTHFLNKRYDEVFIDECNYRTAVNDDVIFEIPFTKTQNGSVGYTWGPSAASNNGETPHVWGECKGSVTLNGFYRWAFADGDLRRNYMIPLWGYDKEGKPEFRANAYTSFCGKWSKLWQDESVAMGPMSTGNDGIGFPYMRYADVLLMYAEAANEWNNGPTDPAREALKTVRARAFEDKNHADMVNQYVAAAGDKESFFKLIMDERKFEFGGEGLRWRDLVRWNKYAEVIRDVFYNYYGAAQAINGNEDYFPGFSNTYPDKIYYSNEEENKGYDYTKFGSMPVRKLKVITVTNPLGPLQGKKGKNEGAFFASFAKDDGTIDPKCCYSLRGYIKSDVDGNITPNNILFGGEENDDPSKLPVVRYILPIPQDAINKSNGAYKNYYGY